MAGGRREANLFSHVHLSAASSGLNDATAAANDDDDEDDTLCRFMAALRAFDYFGR